jgi:two-component system C4-dicarboxylate transport sensor histidine kinase DctB
VLAASNWDAEISFVGVDLSYRPYFQDAVRTGLGRFYGIGTTSGEPGYYYAKPIVDGGSMLGVAAVKVSLDKLQSPWRRSPTTAAMAVDGDGVVILASEPGWKYRTLEPLPRAVLDRVKATRQFENVPLEPLGIRTERELDGGTQVVSLPSDAAGGRRRLLLQERVLPPSGWRMIILSDLEDLGAATRAARAMAGLGLGSAMLLVLFLRQRRRVVGLELAAKRALEHANLEARAEGRGADPRPAGGAGRAGPREPARRPRADGGRRRARAQPAARGAPHALGQCRHPAPAPAGGGGRGNLGMIAQIVDRMARSAAS